MPYTEIALLSGTASLHIQPYVADELFILKTPTNSFISRYPYKSYARVGSYMDAMTVTPLEGGVLHLPGVARETIANGRTLTYREGRLVDPAGEDDSATFAAWDKWVAERFARRTAAISDVMTASGLPAPIPGMAEMSGRGTFFDCEPYGTCWEPSAAENPQQPGGNPPESQASSAAPAQKPAKAARTGSPAPIQTREYEDNFPCQPASLRYRVARDSNTGRAQVVDTVIEPNPVPYDWAVCHAGSWTQRNHRYVWVAGHRRHHLAPIRWVRSGRSVGFVPIHPYDVKGRLPVNRKNEIFAIDNKNGHGIDRTHFDPERPIELLKAPPKEFSKTYFPPLPRAEVPHAEAHQLNQPVGGKGVIARTPGVPLHFDPKSQSFLMARQTMQGNRTVTVFAPVSNRTGDLQAHAGGGYSGGGGSHGFSGGGSGGSSGGGSHSSGGGGGSSGGSHGSGGSSSSSVSSSSASSSSSSSSAGSSSAHH